MKLIVNLLVSVALVVCSSAAVAEIVTPAALVKNTANEVLEIIKNDRDIQAGDMHKINALAEDKVLPHFDFERMSRLVLGKDWSPASKEQQGLFINQFRTLLIRTYASALSKYRNQTIEYKTLSEQSGDTDVTVKTLILQPGGEPLPLNYKLDKAGEDWKVYDLEINGVSLVNSYRGQFSTEIRKSGMDGLIQKLADKNK